MSIILNIGVSPNWPTDESWPPCSFFAIYDGHGSSLVSNFLKDNLHHYVAEQFYLFISLSDY